jgi:phenazine biosynthesis protein phzE
VLTLSVASEERLEVADVLARLPQHRTAPAGEVSYDYSDAEFQRIVERVIKEEVYEGEGSSFVTPRTATVKLESFEPEHALSIYRRLLENEYGAYFCFCFFTGDEFFIGATPERQLTVNHRTGRIQINPISGTYRKAPAAAKSAETQVDEFLEFLKDPKEIDELFMVTDEELKMMAHLCPEGGQCIGPLVKEMPFVIHTEYELEGFCKGKDSISLLRDTMFCPTVIGSPLGNACSVVRKYEEGRSRSYYSSAIVLMGKEEGHEFLDSAITIRTMEIDARGEVTLRAGATLVKDSDPASEVEECKAKLRGALSSLAPQGRELPPRIIPLIPRPKLDEVRGAMPSPALQCAGFAEFLGQKMPNIFLLRSRI